MLVLKLNAGAHSLPGTIVNRVHLLPGEALEFVEEDIQELPAIELPPNIRSSAKTMVSIGQCVPRSMKQLQGIHSSDQFEQCPSTLNLKYSDASVFPPPSL